MSLAEVRDKVKKLLRLAQNDGATEAEASLAAEKAQALLEEHKIARETLGDITEVRETAGHEMHKVQLRTPHWRRVLRKACADTSGCFSMAGAQGEWHIFGTASDIALTRELYAFLGTQVERQARAWMHGNAPGTLRRGAGAAFRVGCASRVGARLRGAYRARQAQRTESHSLVIYDAARQAHAVAMAMFPQQSAGYTRKTRDMSAYSAGVNAGERVRLTPERALGTLTQRRIA